MNDDVKAAAFAQVVRARMMVAESRDELTMVVHLDECRALLAHLGGEPARLAAAREEQHSNQLDLLEQIAALRARVAELEGQRRGASVQIARAATAEERAEKAEAERDDLRAQVEAARSECARLQSVNPTCGDNWEAATDVLRAMDEAKP